MPAVLMIGGGVQQRAAVRLAQGMGLEVIVSDRSPAAPCFELADERWQVDGTDVDELAARAAAAVRTRDLRGVFTLTELVETTAVVARAAGLPGVAPEAARACQDKALAAERWSAAGVATPRTRCVRTSEEALRALEALDGRAFVKPARGFGGRGAGRVRGEDELRALLGGGCRTGGDDVPWLVQELVEGPVHDVNAILDPDGRFRSAGVAERRFHSELPIELGARAPSGLDAAEQAELLALVEAAARALGIDFGPLKADVVRGADGRFRVLELAPRLHGPKGTLWLLPLALGFEPWRAALRVLTGAPLDPADLAPTRRRACVYRALAAEPGEVVAIRGVEDALALEGVEHVLPLVRPGDRVRRCADSTGVPGYVFATGRDAAEASRRLDAAERRIAIETRPAPGAEAAAAAALTRRP